MIHNEVLTMHLFNKVEILHTHKISKKPIEVVVRINFDCPDVFLAPGPKPTVEGYIDPTTKLLVTSKYTPPGEPEINAHYMYIKLAQDYARVECATFLEKVLSLSAEEYSAQGYKSPENLKQELREALSDDTKMWAHLTKELSLLRTLPLPAANTKVVFQDEETNGQIITQRIPYAKPSPKYHEHVADFLSTFFNDEDAEYFAWYLGAMLLNKSMSDYNISKMMVMSSAIGGAGKSTLITTITKHVFTPTFTAVVADYDTFFMNDSRFTTADLPTKRLTVFLEAAWGKPVRDTHNHDFEGMNTNAIKAIVADGYLDTEKKYGQRRTDIVQGGHIVLSNYMPRINQKDYALLRRILPVIVKPTTMLEKARALDLMGSKFEEYIETHAQEFAEHFMFIYESYPTLVVDYIYNPLDYIKELDDSTYTSDMRIDKVVLSKHKSDRKSLNSLLDYIESLGVDISKLRHNIETCDNSKYANVRIENGIVWVNSSIKYLKESTSDYELVSTIFRYRYGQPEVKFNKRRYKCNKYR